MSAQRYALNFAVIAAMYNCSESFVKRMSAAGVDLKNPREVLKYINEHARSQTRESVERSDYFTDVFAALNGTSKVRIQEAATAGVNIRDPEAVKEYLRTNRAQSPPSTPTAPGKLKKAPAPKQKSAAERDQIIAARKQWLEETKPAWTEQQKRDFLNP